MKSIEEDRIREEMQADIFSRQLEAFVRQYAPRGYGCYEFQRALMELFVSAMRSQRYTFSTGIDHYASQLYEQSSLRPLAVIMKEPK